MTNQLLPGPIEAARIMEYLPHRYPFLLIDRVLTLEMEPAKRLTAIKNVTLNEEFFQGHFPGEPVMPGVLMIEAMAQAAGMLAYLSFEIEGKESGRFYLVKVDNAKFNQVVVPGDQLLLDVTQKRLMRNLGQYQCRVTVEGKRVASCDIMCAEK